MNDRPPITSNVTFFAPPRLCEFVVDPIRDLVRSPPSLSHADPHMSEKCRGSRRTNGATRPALQISYVRSDILTFTPPPTTLTNHEGYRSIANHGQTLPITRNDQPHLTLNHTHLRAPLRTPPNLQSRYRRSKIHVSRPMINQRPPPLLLHRL